MTDVGSIVTNFNMLTWYLTNFEEKKVKKADKQL